MLTLLSTLCCIGLVHAATLRGLQLSSQLYNFAKFSTGHIVTTLDDGAIQVVAKKRQGSKEGKLVAASAMIFDSASPTGGDLDLGTPNADFGGPGIGSAGKRGSPVANAVAQGKVLIISEDNDVDDPDDHRFGGFIEFQFSEPVFVEEMGLLDNEERTKFDVVHVDGLKQNVVAGRGMHGFCLVESETHITIA